MHARKRQRGRWLGGTPFRPILRLPNRPPCVPAAFEVRPGDTVALESGLSLLLTGMGRPAFGGFSKFMIHRGTLGHELRKYRGHEQVYNSTAAFDLMFLKRACRICSGTRAAVLTFRSPLRRVFYRKFKTNAAPEIR